MPVEKRSPPAARPPSRVPVRPSAPAPAAARPAAPRRPLRPAGPLVRGPRVLPLILWPAVITLAVTVLRLVGELRGWSPAYFSRIPGGGLSPLGIAWLAPVFGLYFGWRLARAGVPAPHPIVAVGVPVLAASGGALVAALAGRILKTSWTGNFTVWGVVSVLVAAVVFASWPALGRILLVYAFAARIPVAIVMALAIWRHWGTHYDAPPPFFPGMLWLRRWLWTGLLLQTTIWVAWTMVTGTIFGPLGRWAAGLRRR